MRRFNANVALLEQERPLKRNRHAFAPFESVMVHATEWNHLMELSEDLRKLHRDSHTNGDVEVELIPKTADCVDVMMKAECAKRFIADSSILRARIPYFAGRMGIGNWKDSKGSRVVVELPPGAIPATFSSILEFAYTGFLQRSTWRKEESTQQSLEALRCMADFFSISTLVQQCNTRLVMQFKCTIASLYCLNSHVIDDEEIVEQSASIVTPYMCHEIYAISIGSQGSIDVCTRSAINRQHAITSRSDAHSFLLRVRRALMPEQRLAFLRFAELLTSLNDRRTDFDEQKTVLRALLLLRPHAELLNDFVSFLPPRFSIVRLTP